jgi:Domain of unknown function (DUF1844)
MGSSDSKQGGFTVTDRRSFAQEGGGGGSGDGDGAGEPKRPPAAAPRAAAGDGVDGPATGPVGGTVVGAGDDADARDATTLPAVDFHTFVLSLGSSALLHLGELEHPEGGPAEKDLPLAKHTIDILSMLEEKTRGNLTSAEERLMQSLLYDLRLRYVNASK